MSEPVVQEVDEDGRNFSNVDPRRKPWCMKIDKVGDVLLFLFKRDPVDFLVDS